jgi:metallophosphoesterase superfamily enzyme
MVASLASGRTFVWIVGNHDKDGPSRLPGEVAAEFAIGALTLRHEPRRGADHGWAAGHLHPCARVVGKGGAVRRRCFVTDGERIVLPAFGAFTGSLNIKDEAFDGLFARTPTAVVLGARKSHPVAWKRLRSD